MSSWIRGRFEGTTIGEPCGDGQPSRSRARRYTLQLHSGTVTEAEVIPEPEADFRGAHETAGDEIRQDRVRRVELPAALIGSESSEAESAERTLFDVRVRDFRFERPVEANGRSYSKIVGTIVASLAPASEPALADAPADPPVPTVEPESSRGPRVHVARDRSAGHRETNGLGAAEQISILQWSLAIFFLVAGTAGIGLACGMRTAALWAAPVALVMFVRRVARPAPLRTPALQWGIGGGAVLLQLGVLYQPLDIAWQLGCRTPIREDLLWLAAPIALAALVRSRWPLYLTTLVWTGVLCSWCSQQGGTCASTEVVPPPATSAVVAPARTDADGRWPIMPPVVPRLGGGAASGEGSLRSDGASRFSAGDERASDLSQASEASGAPIEMPVPAREAETPDEPRSAASKSRRAAAPSTSGGKGGWIAPDHRRAEREMVLISVEQANRTPQSFFGNGANRRVYLPSDRIFEQGSATIGQRGALELTRLAALVSLRPERRVALDVHTDAAGAPETQLRLSEQRAAALLAWLTDRGHLDPGQLEAGGLGGSRPIVPPDGSYTDQTPNRRIEVRLVD